MTQIHIIKLNNVALKDIISWYKFYILINKFIHCLSDVPSKKDHARLGTLNYDKYEARGL